MVLTDLTPTCDFTFYKIVLNTHSKQLVLGVFYPSILNAKPLNWNSGAALGSYRGNRMTLTSH